MTAQGQSQQNASRDSIDSQRVLVICTGNSARSQMAEGLFRHLAGSLVSAHSAGSEPAEAVHPLAVQVMAEIDIDLTGHRPKPLTEFLGQPVDVVIAVCSRAAIACPAFPGPAARLDWFYEDPAAVEGSSDEQLDAFRRIRDDLERRIAAWLNRDH